MNASVDITNYLPFVATLLGGGVAVTLIAQAIKRIFGLSSGHVIHLMVVAISLVAAAAQYVLQAKQLPLEVLGISGTTIYGVSQFVYNESGYLKNLVGRVQINLAPATVPLASATPAVALTAEPMAPAVTDPVTDPATPTEAAPAAPSEFNA